MNKIYRRLWSSARQCWVVTSELASPRGKPSSTLRRGAATAVVVLLALPAGAAELDEDGVRWWQLQTLSAFMAPSAAAPITPTALKVHRMDVYANTERAKWSVVSGRESMALGPEAQATGESSLAAGIRSRAEGDRSVTLGSLSEAWGNNSIAIGHYAVASGGGFGTAIGTYSKAEGVGATAVGQNAKARKENSIAVGSGAQTDGGAGNSRIAIGGNAYAGSDGYTGAIALGGGSRAERDGIAIGHGARASAAGAVALGRDAVATEMNTVSVGSAAKKRRVVNVDDGRVSSDSFDAVNGRQLKVARDTAQRGVDDAANAKAGADYALARAQDARRVADAALGASGLVTQDSAGGNMRVGGQNAGDQISFANRNNEARYLNGIRNGTLSSTSTDAVTGQQLFATHQALDPLVKLVAGGAMGGKESARARGEGALAMGAEAIANGNHATALGLDAQATANQATAIGRQSRASGVFSAALGNNAQASAQSALALGDRAVASHSGSVALGLQSQTTGSNQVSVGNGDLKRRIVNVADGAVNASSHDAITGRQLHATNNEVGTVRSTAAAAQSAAANAARTADMALAQSGALGALLGQASPDGAVRLGAGNAGTAVDIRSSSGAGRTLDGVADGRIDAGSDQAVSGRQLFATQQGVEENAELLASHGVALAAQSDRIDGNRSDLDALRSAFEDFDPDLEGVVKFSPDGSVDVATGKLRNVAAGDISSAASMDAVNGGQLYAANERIASMEHDSRFLKIGTDEISEDASAGKFAVAIGELASASTAGEGGTSVGSFSQAEGVNSIALGRAAEVTSGATEGFALGAGSRVAAVGGMALGGRAQVISSAVNSVALGTASYADESNVVSIGSDLLKRRIVNAADGRTSNDVSTVGQLARAVALLGAGAGVDGTGNIVAPEYRIQGGTQNNVGDALSALDRAVVTTDIRVDSLEGKLRSAFQDGPSMRADGLDQLALAGAHGSVLTNLADGRIVAGSRDAVTGSQLFEAKQEIERNRSDLDDLRVERDELLSHGLMAAGQGNVIDYGGARLTGVADGALSLESSDVVTGRQLFGTNERLAGLEQADRFVVVSSDQESVGAIASHLSVAIGDSAVAGTSGNQAATAIGLYARALGRGAVALGAGAFVDESSDQGFALGVGSEVRSSRSEAIGASARVSRGASQSVALGNASVASEAFVVSVGADTFKRRIVNVANGRNANDAATVGQLRGALSTLGGDIDANGNIINPTFNIQGGQQSTLNEALSSLDSAVVTSGNRVDRVESQLNAVFQDTPTVRNDGLNQLTFAGANGMVLSNVANGVVAAGSRDAVNGGQLHSMQQQLNGRMDGLEHRIDGQPQSLALATVAGDEPSAPTPPASAGDKVLADNGNAPKSAPQPQADAPKPESPTPQVDTAELEKMLARANEYSDGISREVDRRLDKMDKRFNRMAAMSSAQSAMAMNTAGLNTYNRLGAGVGYSEGESAMAVGYQRVLNDKGSATFSLNGAFTNSGERSMGVGVGIGW
ncbi:ESPR-type extended signal peptide-containing protein [Stenotrophomonas sp. CC120223-11]|uniref:ESPR-type extended signal peptide-containing protein n=1 Tax=Stenotrophomonas sp. CC120223-11 TaxID=1378090 RepID=UPI000BDBC8A6|nr:ESPR-type extended signal peptide-containing protein [Stenotrophomonas sp. CC120223-11]SNY72795.1 Head domain of trimeric autotransporter adhesin [Stenotrophomonas sp. CC120223-11]